MGGWETQALVVTQWTVDSGCVLGGQSCSYFVDWLVLSLWTDVVDLADIVMEASLLYSIG